MLREQSWEKRPKQKGRWGLLCRGAACCSASRPSLRAETAAETLIRTTVVAFWTISLIIMPIIYYNNLQLMDATQGN